MGNEILRCAQDDKGGPIRLSWPDELIVQSVGIHGNSLRPYNPLIPINWYDILWQAY